MIPNNAALAGTVLHQQLVVVETDASMAFVETTTSNALVLTAGKF